MRLRLLAVVVALGSSVLWASPAEAASAARPYDFNGDGFPELVVGAPGLRVESVAGEGGVVVLPASARGLSLAERVISQSIRGVPGTSEGGDPEDPGSRGGDRFGSEVASADFDRDGYADLAVGQPGENEQAGAVTVIYGSSRGLDTTRSRWIGRISDGRFGSALVAGDFNGDRYPDLAVGAPGAERIGVGEPDPDSHDNIYFMSGTVTVLSGGSTGLSWADPVVLRRQGGDDFDANFGAELAVGDLNRDGTTDLVVLSAGILDAHTEYPGSISYCPGQVGGSPGCTHLVHHFDYGLSAVAVGDMSGDARPEIVVGLPFSEHGGAVRVLHLGARMPLTVAREEMLSQSSRGVPGTNEFLDRFGSSIALGDIDRDSYADLVIGATGENDGRGRVTVVHGAAAGWRTAGNRSYSQDTRGIPGVAETGDGFGSDVSLRDHNRDGRLDVTIGAPGENAAGLNYGAGAITTLRGSGRGFTTTGASTFGLTTLGYAYPAGAEFGVTLGNRSAPSAG